MAVKYLTLPVLSFNNQIAQIVYNGANLIADRDPIQFSNQNNLLSIIRPKLLANDSLTLTKVDAKNYRLVYVSDSNVLNALMINGTLYNFVDYTSDLNDVVIPAAVVVTPVQTSDYKLLASKSYCPNNFVSVANTTTLADVDATNLSITFIAPATGTVEVRLSAMSTGGGAGVRSCWGLRNGTTDIIGTEQVISNDASVAKREYSQIVSGLVPNTTYTFKWSQRASTATGSLNLGWATSGTWPANMRVYSAGVQDTLAYNTFGIQVGGQISSQNYVVKIPAGPGPRPLVIYNHGRSGTYQEMITAGPITTVVDALLAEGYMVCTSDAHLMNFGNDLGIDDNKAVYDLIAASYSISKVILFGASMGAVNSSLLLSGIRTIPNCVGFIGISPMLNLANAFTDTTNSFQSQITTAYGITGTTPNTYAEKTAGHDPLLIAKSAYSGKRFRFYVSANDAIVPPTLHTDLFKAAIKNVALESDVIQCSGGHTDASQYQPADVVAFCRRCIAK